MGVTDCARRTAEGRGRTRTGGRAAKRRSTYFSHAAPPTAATPAAASPLQPLPPPPLPPPPNEGRKKSQTMFLDKTHKAALGAAAEVAREGKAAATNGAACVTARLPNRPASASSPSLGYGHGHPRAASTPATQCCSSQPVAEDATSQPASLLRQAAAPLPFRLDLDLNPHPLPLPLPLPSMLGSVSLGSPLSYLSVCLSDSLVAPRPARVVQVRLHSSLSLDLECNCTHGAAQQRRYLGLRSPLPTKHAAIAHPKGPRFETRSSQRTILLPFLALLYPNLSLKGIKVDLKT